MLFFPLLLQAATVVSSPPAPTVQQRFDAATLAAAEGRCADAVPAFDALAKLRAIQRSELVRVTLGLRRAACLIGTERNDEAEPAIRVALPVLERQGAAFADEAAEARRSLADLAKERGDYDGAIHENELALAGVTGLARVAMLAALTDLTMFDHDGRALRYAEEARALAVAPAAPKRLIASVQTLYARVLLNEGRKAEAYKILKDSLAKQGGLTTRVSIDDLETRSDLAIAALVNNDRDGAREYLAYTGAGRMKKSFTRPVQMDLPRCGSDGLKPEDFAIIRLALAADGHVASVTPIYVGGNRSAALAFARTVRGWSWPAEVAASISPLFRATTRVELRCSTGQDERLTLDRLLLDAVPDWSADEQGSGTAWEGVSDAVALPRQRAALARAGQDQRARLRIMLAILANSVLPRPDRLTMAAEAASLAAALDAPTPLQLYLAMGTLDDGKFQSLLANPRFTGDPLSAAVLRVAASTSNPIRKSKPAVGALLDAAIAQPGLPDRHPIKVRALLLKANMLSATGDPAGAAAALAQTGLTAGQCSIGGVIPAAKRINTGPNQYPNAARDMGFEGWARTEFDIAANGRTIAPRTIAAYPPFVFDDAATGIARGAQYASTYQPDAPVACSANTMNIAFTLPK